MQFYLDLYKNLELVKKYKFKLFRWHTNVNYLFIWLAIHTIPPGVFGGLSIILFSLITMSGARIWVENQVDFKDTRNLLVAGIPGLYIHNTIMHICLL